MFRGAGEIVRIVYTFFDLAGVAVIAGGLLLAVYRASRQIVRGRAHGAFVVVRTTFGRSILLGLELLLAADLIRTMAVEPTIENLAALALLIAIRTFLSWTLEVEIDGRWPWQRPAQPQR